MNLVVELKKLYNSSSTLIENMKSVHNKCVEEDLMYGKGWYNRANFFSLALSEKYGVSEMKAAGIIAALSPLKEWTLNKAMAEEFIRTKGVISKHTSMQTMKARKILNQASTVQDVENYLGGLKTVNFFNNIYNPFSKDHVTVDRHHIYLSLGWDAQSCTTKQYEFIKQNTIILANELNIIPNELQSTLWVCWKRIKKNEEKTN
jgi:hypothetical protein